MAAVDDLHAELKPYAVSGYSSYILARTPPAMQEDMAALVAADLSGQLDPDPTFALVEDGANVVVTDDGVAITGSPGAAVVEDSVLTSVAVLTP
jgi:hypothetical protein